MRIGVLHIPSSYPDDGVLAPSIISPWNVKPGFAGGDKQAGLSGLNYLGKSREPGTPPDSGTIGGDSGELPESRAD